MAYQADVLNLVTTSESPDTIGRPVEGTHKNADVAERVINAQPVNSAEALQALADANNYALSISEYTVPTTGEVVPPQATAEPAPEVVGEIKPITFTNLIEEGIILAQLRDHEVGRVNAGLN